MARLSRRATRKYQVFVSHATADKWLARVICEKLESLGASTFRDDRDIDGGDDIPDRIREEIARSHEIVVILTPMSVTRPWILVEVGAAWQRRIRILALRQHVTTEPIPALLQSKRSMDLNEFDQFLEQLAKRMKGKR